jgi:hypothetical protein
MMQDMYVPEMSPTSQWQVSLAIDASDKVAMLATRAHTHAKATTFLIGIGTADSVVGLYSADSTFSA